MSLYGRLFAAGYDKFMAGPEKAVLRDHRKALLGRVAGRVIEVGGGTGANLPFYGPGVNELIITSPRSRWRGGSNESSLATRCRPVW